MGPQGSLTGEEEDGGGDGQGSPRNPQENREKKSGPFKEVFAIWRIHNAERRRKKGEGGGGEGRVYWVGCSEGEEREMGNGQGKERNEIEKYLSGTLQCLA